MTSGTPPRPGAAAQGPMVRRVLLLAHTGRAAALTTAHELVLLLHRRGVVIAMLPEELADLRASARDLCVTADPADPLSGVDLVVVLGGDGTILRASEVVHGTSVPLLGVNLGHVGFLAEAERDDLVGLAERIGAGAYDVEERMTLDVTAVLDGTVIGRAWAVNEASVEKSAHDRMIELVVEVDGRPVTEFGCDGMVLATPTGSTAYAFSAGGPILWPEVEALVLAPLSAHALFARPLVVAPNAVPAVEVVPPGRAVLWCDGRRSIELPPGARVEVRRSPMPLVLARLSRPPFADRLVAKFALPVHGWRGQARLREPDRAAPAVSGAQPSPDVVGGTRPPASGCGAPGAAE